MSGQRRSGLFTGKRGFVYSMIGVVVMIILLSIFINSRDSSRASKSYSESMAIKAMDEKIQSIQDDIERGAYIVGFRTVLSLDDMVATSGNYVTYLPLAFEEIFMNGSFDGENITYMENMSFNTFMTNLKDSFDELQLNIDADVKGLEIFHEGSWHVTVAVKMEMNISDKAGLASWSDNHSFSAEVPIVEMTDPVYVVKTSGLVMNQIFRTNITDFVSGNDVSNLEYHNKNMLYKESKWAPSYLKRLEGDMSPDEHGIESLVYIPTLQNQGIIPLNRSVVDYIYFADSNWVLEKYQVEGMEDWFYLDKDHNHTEEYGVEAILI
jgi:hypothetical protein